MMDLITIVGVPILRSIFGWAENAMADISDGGAKITKFELAQLASTVLRLGVPGLALYYGLNMEAGIAAGIPLLVEYLVKYINKVVEKTKE